MDGYVLRQAKASWIEVGKEFKAVLERTVDLGIIDSQTRFIPTGPMAAKS
jgi:hypothetical protein